MSNRSIAPMAASVAAVLWFSTAQAGPASKTTQVSAPPAPAQPSAAFLERADQILAVYNGQARMRPILSEKAAAEATVSPDGRRQRGANVRARQEALRSGAGRQPRRGDLALQR